MTGARVWVWLVGDTQPAVTWSDCLHLRCILGACSLDTTALAASGVCSLFRQEQGRQNWHGAHGQGTIASEGQNMVVLFPTNVSLQHLSFIIYELRKESVEMLLRQVIPIYTHYAHCLKTWRDFFNIFTNYEFGIQSLEFEEFNIIPSLSTSSYHSRTSSYWLLIFLDLKTQPGIRENSQHWCKQ